ASPVQGTVTAVAAPDPDGAGAGTATAGVVKLAVPSFKEGDKIQFRSGDGAVQEYTLTATDTDMASLVTSLTSDFGSADLTFSAGAGADAGKLILTGNADGSNAVTLSYVPGTTGRALATIDDAIAKVTEGSAMLGANKALLETQEEFISVLSDSLTAGVSTFVDADMNEASTRNQALQTQQQLGVQALSMANQNSSMILRLFQ
uniref:flagellin n=1 Tax=Microvirga sp. G4-2 TaxID=3434467 RepID=UPI004044DC49